MLEQSNIINALIGGTIMAISSSFHLLLEGKITGISGTFFRFVKGDSFMYNFSFILGMTFISNFAKYYDFSSSFFESRKEYINGLSLLGFIFAGFLVGLGTKWANGCTSGHGVCGLPRISIRSIVAVGTFCVFGIGFATLRYYFPFLNKESLIDQISIQESKGAYLFIIYFCIICFIALVLYNIYQRKRKELRDLIISLMIGLAFSYGLLKSGMTCRHKVINFLSLSKDWDYTLIFVLGSAVGINLITFNFILKKVSTPVFNKNYQVPTNTNVDLKLILGASIFGIGWGLAGICPGPAVLASFMYFPHSLFFIIMMSFGQFCGYWTENLFEKKNFSNLIKDKKVK